MREEGKENEGGGGGTPHQQGPIPPLECSGPAAG